MPVVPFHIVHAFDSSMECLGGSLSCILILAFPIAYETFAIARDDECLHSGILTLACHLDDTLQRQQVLMEIIDFSLFQRCNRL